MHTFVDYFGLYFETVDLTHLILAHHMHRLYGHSQDEPDSLFIIENKQQLLAVLADLVNVWCMTIWLFALFLGA